MALFEFSPFDGRATARVAALQITRSLLRARRARRRERPTRWLGVYMPFEEDIAAAYAVKMPSARSAGENMPSIFGLRAARHAARPCCYARASRVMRAML